MKRDCTDALPVTREDFEISQKAKLVHIVHNWREVNVNKALLDFSKAEKREIKHSQNKVN